MRDGKCPKCGSANVYTAQDDGIDVKINFRAARTESYLCTDCGYVETYVIDKSKLEDVTKKWKKVSG